MQYHTLAGPHPMGVGWDAPILVQCSAGSVLQVVFDGVSAKDIGEAVMEVVRL